MVKFKNPVSRLQEIEDFLSQVEKELAVHESQLKEAQKRNKDLMEKLKEAGFSSLKEARVRLKEMEEEIDESMSSLETFLGERGEE